MAPTRLVSDYRGSGRGETVQDALGEELTVELEHDVGARRVQEPGRQQRDPGARDEEVTIDTNVGREREVRARLSQKPAD